MSEHEQSCPYDEDRWCGYTDAEVLAEMGGEREWVCREWNQISDEPLCEPDRQWHLACGWVWIVKEADDE